MISGSKDDFVKQHFLKETPNNHQVGPLPPLHWHCISLSAGIILLVFTAAPVKGYESWLLRFALQKLQNHLNLYYFVDCLHD